MALDVAGRHDEARAAYDWLRRTPEPGRLLVPRPTAAARWPTATAGGQLRRVPRRSALLAPLLTTGDDALPGPDVADAAPRRSTSCSACRRRGGEIRWARGADGRPADEALLTGCSSMYHGLRCALALAARCGEPQPDWELAAATLGHAIAAHPERFSPRDRYSMDWYYPILGGALRGAAARGRLAAGWDRFVVPGLGVRCVSDQPVGDRRRDLRTGPGAVRAGRARPGRRAVRQPCSTCATTTARTGPGTSTPTTPAGPRSAPPGPRPRCCWPSAALAGDRPPRPCSAAIPAGRAASSASLRVRPVPWRRRAPAVP